MPGPLELVNTPFIYFQMCPEKKGGYRFSINIGYVQFWLANDITV